MERLRRQIVELQEKNHESREEVRWLEAQLLECGFDSKAAAAGGIGAGGLGRGVAKSAGVSRGMQTEPLTSAASPGWQHQHHHHRQQYPQQQQVSEKGERMEREMRRRRGTLPL